MLETIERQATALAQIAIAERHYGQLDRIRARAVMLLLAIRAERCLLADVVGLRDEELERAQEVAA